MDGGAVQAKIIGKMVEQRMTNHNVVRFWSLGLDKNLPRVARVHKKNCLGRVLAQPIPNYVSISKN